MYFAEALFSKYTDPGTATFVAPAGVTKVDVLVVGGGGGGGYPDSAGGSGSINRATLAVTPGTSYSVAVGAGGHTGCYNDNSPDGDASSFGSDMLTAAGGVRGIPYSGGAGAGGSGGGAGSENSLCPGGSNGGTNGGAGGSCNDAQGGAGQGESQWNTFLAPFKYNSLTAGNGGAGMAGTSEEYPPSRTAGGGGGGVLFNGEGGNAADGGGSICNGKAGAGYGGGGGAGGFSGEYNSCSGRGSDGLVYIEWKTPV